MNGMMRNETTVLITKCQLSSDTPLVGIAALCYALQCCLNPQNPEPPPAPPAPPAPRNRRLLLLDKVMRTQMTLFADLSPFGAIFGLQ